MRKILAFALLLATATGLVACNEREVAVGVGVVGGSVVTGAYYDGYYGWDYRDSRGYYNDGRGYWDRWDGRYYRCGRYWCRDGRYHPRPWMHSDSVTSFSQKVSAADREAAVAHQYRMPEAAARLVDDAFDRVQRYGDLNSFQTVGLSQTELARVKSGGDFSSNAIAEVSKALRANSSSVRALLRDVHDEYQLYAQGSVKVTN